MADASLDAELDRLSLDSVCGATTRTVRGDQDDDFDVVYHRAQLRTGSHAVSAVSLASSASSASAHSATSLLRRAAAAADAASTRRDAARVLPPKPPRRASPSSLRTTHRSKQMASATSTHDPLDPRIPIAPFQTLHRHPQRVRTLQDTLAHADVHVSNDSRSFDHRTPNTDIDHTNKFIANGGHRDEVKAVGSVTSHAWRTLPTAARAAEPPRALDTHRKAIGSDYTAHGDVLGVVDDDIGLFIAQRDITTSASGIFAASGTHTSSFSSDNVGNKQRAYHQQLRDEHRWNLPLGSHTERSLDVITDSNHASNRRRNSQSPARQTRNSIHASQNHTEWTSNREQDTIRLESFDNRGKPFTYHNEENTNTEKNYNSNKDDNDMRGIGHSTLPVRIRGNSQLAALLSAGTMDDNASRKPSLSQNTTTQQDSAYLVRGEHSDVSQATKPFKVNSTISHHFHDSKHHSFINSEQNASTSTRLGTNQQQLSQQTFPNTHNRKHLPQPIENPQSSHHHHHHHQQQQQQHQQQQQQSGYRHRLREFDNNNSIQDDVSNINIAAVLSPVGSVEVGVSHVRKSSTKRNYKDPQMDFPMGTNGHQQRKQPSTHQIKHNQYGAAPGYYTGAPNNGLGSGPSTVSIIRVKETENNRLREELSKVQESLRLANEQNAELIKKNEALELSHKEKITTMEAAHLAENEQTRQAYKEAMERLGNKMKSEYKSAYVRAVKKIKDNFVTIEQSRNAELEELRRDYANAQAYSKSLEVKLSDAQLKIREAKQRERTARMRATQDLEDMKVAYQSSLQKVRDDMAIWKQNCIDKLRHYR